MFTFFLILIFLVAIFLVLVILVQNPKGSALGSGFTGAAGNIIGVQKTGDVLEKITWGSLGVIVLLCIATSFLLPKSGAEEKAKTRTEDIIGTPLAPSGQTTKPNVAPANNAQPDQSQKPNPATDKKPAK